MILARELASILGDNIIQEQLLFPEVEIRFLNTDSRRLSSIQNAIFFAIVGPRNNGHQYLEGLKEKGFQNFVLETIPLNFTKTNFWQVKNSVLALQQIAAYHRQKFNYPVFALTGSNGKTIVKEWLAQAASPEFMVVKSPGSYNSQIGVPLSIWQMTGRQNLAIIEAGVSKAGEMQNLENVIKPTFGIFTTFGPAHDEGFSSRNAKLREKLVLFKDVKKLIYNAGNAIIREFFLLNPQWKPRLFSWLILNKQIIDGFSCKVLVSTDGGTLNLTLPFIDDASVENAVHVAAALKLLEWSDALIQEKLSQLQSSPMRLELKLGVSGSLIIDDSYSLDLGSLQLALDFMAQKHRVGTRKVVILSDFLETGLGPDLVSKQVNELLKQKEIDILHLIGPEAETSKAYFTIPEVYAYTNTEQFIEQASESIVEGRTVLIKGARKFQFERIVALFSEKIHGTRLEINLNAIVLNLNFYRTLIQPVTKVMAMVKAFAYGAGAVEVAKLLQFHKVDYLAVAYADEGVQLRKAGITLPIMVMNTAADGMDKLFQYQLEPVIYSKEIWLAYAIYCKNNGVNGNIHIELDTGMSRLGFSETDDAWLLKEVTALRGKVLSVFSHLAGADSEEHNQFSNNQIASFNTRTTSIENVLGYHVTKHILNSSGIVRFPNAHLDMVRLGIGLYGIEPNNQYQDQLKTVASLKTTISQIRHIPKGTTVSYSRRGVAETDLTIATLAIGYSDGFDRRLSNGIGEVIIQNTRCKVIGSVCMDMTMVDVTGLNAKVGDDVIVFNDVITIEEIAQKLGTIPYEILTSVNERVKRVFFSD
jgi:alanine racemase